MKRKVGRLCMVLGVVLILSAAGAGAAGHGAVELRGALCADGLPRPGGRYGRVM